MLQLKNVHFRGHVNDIRAIWEQNHLLVLPSRYEGLPLALVEAMWCGRPAVVTDVGGNAELCVGKRNGICRASGYFIVIRRYPGAGLGSAPGMGAHGLRQRERESKSRYRRIQSETSAND